MSECGTFSVVEAVARDSYGRLIAYLSARSGDVAGAEDALGDAFAQALKRWPADGIPGKPEAWLLRVARNRIIDDSRRRQVRQDLSPYLQVLAEGAEEVGIDSEPIPD